jgi:hypothetical protein
LGMMIEEVTFLDMQLKTTSSSSSPNWLMLLLILVAKLEL